MSSDELELALFPSNFNIVFLLFDLSYLLLLLKIRKTEKFDRSIDIFC